MTAPIARNILLTGAGFTYNFGGFLTEQMWSIIFNHPLVQRQTAVREWMLNLAFGYNYEAIYHSILRVSPKLSGKEFSEEDKEAIKVATFVAYRRLDELLCRVRFSGGFIDKVKLSHDLIDKFSSNNSEHNYFFTLNQDLFMERYHDSHPKAISLPGVTRVPALADGFKRDRELTEEDFLTLYDENKMEATKSAFPSPIECHYVKLHGSLNWRSFDGSDAMVIGDRKEEQINKEPLLKWYFEIFKEVLFQTERKLMVIGYGFGDEHINGVHAMSL